MDIIDNVITYSPYYVTRTSANGSEVYWSRDTDGNHVTSILHYHCSRKRKSMTATFLVYVNKKLMHIAGCKSWFN